MLTGLYVWCGVVVYDWLCYGSDDDTQQINLDDHKGPVRDFLVLESTRIEIKR